MTLQNLAAVALVLSIAGCGGGGGDDDTSRYPLEVTVTKVDGAGNRVFAVGTYVVRSQDAWQSTWSSGQNWLLTDSPAPALDFTRLMVVGVSAGLGPGCDGRWAAIDKVFETSSAIEVEYRLQDVAQPPVPGISCHGTLTFPLNHFVALPLSSKPVTFVRKLA